MSSVHNTTRKTTLHAAVRTFFKYKYVSVVIKIQPIFNSQMNVNGVQVLTFHILLKASSSSMLEIERSQRISNCNAPSHSWRSDFQRHFGGNRVPQLVYLSPVSLGISLEMKYDFNLIPNFT